MVLQEKLFHKNDARSSSACIRPTLGKTATVVPIKPYFSPEIKYFSFEMQTNEEEFMNVEILGI
jgi:hypothetical protein